jgi:hypothetical protein
LENKKNKFYLSFPFSIPDNPLVAPGGATLEGFMRTQVHYNKFPEDVNFRNKKKINFIYHFFLFLTTPLSRREARR